MGYETQRVMRERCRSAKTQGAGWGGVGWGEKVSEQVSINNYFDVDILEKKLRSKILEASMRMKPPAKLINLILNQINQRTSWNLQRSCKNFSLTSTVNFN